MRAPPFDEAWATSSPSGAPRLRSCYHEDLLMTGEREAARVVVIVCNSLRCSNLSKPMRGGPT